ncbi:type VII secretion protein EssA [Salipaludibacillus sp. HK11]|uniref:type VII secretion protein EssA n=1 Tax=Salipaludibacillus sp. HK11 TaxID=3394320 RepID=UPI0039FD51A6
MPLSISAENSTDTDKGKIDWKIERISEKDRNSDHSNQETQLEKRFPDLFKGETFDEIQNVKENQQESLEYLEQNLFALEVESNSTIEDMKQALFTTDYVAPTATTSSEEEQINMGSSFLLIGFVSIASFISWGIYVMFQKLTD